MIFMSRIQVLSRAMLFAFFLCAGSLKATNCFAQQTKHVVLISIDGFHPDMYLDKSWPSNNLRALAARGTYADHMLSVFPSYTYPSHTAMVTGAFPARSGVFFNQPKFDNSGNWNWFADVVRVPTLWKVLKENGLTTASVEWPVSVTKDITWNVPEIWSEKYPDRITVARQYATLGLVEELERNATGKLDNVSMNEDRFSMDANSARMAGYIFNKYKPALLTVHFAEVDGVEHDKGRDADSVRLALEAVDQNIGYLLEAINASKMKDSTTVIIVGDHGFSDIHEAFRPNMLIRSLPVRFIASGGSAFLYNIQHRDKDGNIIKEKNYSKNELVKMVIDSLDKLPTAKRKLFRIINRKELDQMGADSSAILALSAKPGLVFSGSMSAKAKTNQGPGTSIQNDPLEGLFFPVSGGHHGYDPNLPEMYTGFIAAGAGIRPGGHIQSIRLVDIAPLIAKLLGIDFKAPDGRLVEGILK